MTPQTTDKMIATLSLDKWREENDHACKELGLSCAKITNRYVSLEVIEALVHDALAYRELNDYI